MMLGGLGGNRLVVMIDIIDDRACGIIWGMKFITFIKSNWRLLLVVLSVNLIALAIECLIAWRLWVELNGRETFGPLNRYFFLWISIGIGSIAIINSITASLLASNSLELTRSTTRPFLNVSGIKVRWNTDDKGVRINYFILQTGNKGTIPADKVSVLFNVNKTNDKNNLHTLISDSEIPSIWFPGEGMSSLKFREAETDKFMLDVGDDLKLKIEISYQNKLTQKTHKTSRSYLVKCTPTAHEEPNPIPEEDDWD